MPVPGSPNRSPRIRQSKRVAAQFTSGRGPIDRYRRADLGRGSASAILHDATGGSASPRPGRGHASAGRRIDDGRTCRCGGLSTHSRRARIRAFCEQLRTQFPDLVLIVAGTTEDQTQLVKLITSGDIYRFLHKPVSPPRVRQFIEAGIRRHMEGATLRRPRPRRRHGEAMPAIFIGIALLIIGATVARTSSSKKVTPAGSTARYPICTTIGHARRAGPAPCRSQP